MNATFRLFKVFKHNKKRVLLSMCLFVGLACFSPSTAYGAGSILQNIWCNTSSFFGFPCEGAWEPMEVIPPKKVPPQKAVSVPSYIQQTLSTLPESVTSRITNVYNTHPVTVVYKSVTAEDDTLTPDVSNEKEDEGYVSLSLFRKQIDSLEDDIGDRVGDATDDLQESFTTETLTVSGTLADSNGSTGLNNYILMSTGSGVVWTSTSSLGFGSNIDFDTSSELADILTDETGTGNVVFSNSPTFSGTITTALIDGCVEVASGVLTSTGANCGVGGGGVTSFNGQVNSSQSFASSTTGTDFRITSSGGVHTFSLPSASASARGLLTSAYFTSFNNRVSSSSIDTSAELIALVTDETGTGSLVFSASPTFTGTALASALTLSSTLTLSGTSANIALGSNWLSGDGDDEGVYVSSTGNVGVGTSSPLARFTVAGGNILMDNTRSITFMDGAGTAREVINVSAGDDITIGATTLDDIRLDVGGVSNALRILQTTGNVGIGTTSPLSRLHIFENTTQVGTLAGLTVEQDGTGDAILQFLLPSRRWVIGADNSDSDKFKISSTVDLNTDAHFVIDISGNIGIGTTTPSAKLHLTGTAGSSDIFAISSSTNSRLFTVAANGRVGIGTSNPVYSLDISGNGRFTSTLSASRFLPNSATSASGNSIYLANTNDIAISNNGVETIRFASDGNVGIGTSTPLARLTVRTTGTTDILNLFETDGSEVFTVLESGNVGIGDTSPAALFTVGSGDLFQVNSSGAIAAATGVTSSGIISVDAGGTQDGHQIGRLGIDYASNGNPTIYSTGGTSIEVAAHLSINGDIYSSVSQASNFILGHNRTGFGIVFRTATSTNSVLSDALTIQSSGNVIVNQGNVGIGTTSPSARLAIVSSGSTAATRAFQIVNSASTNLFRIDDTGDILLTDSGVDQFTFGVSTAQFGRVSGQALGVSISGIAKVLFGGTGGEYRTMSGGIYGWSSHASNVASAVADTALSRTSAGVVAVGNGTSGNTSGTLLASSIGIGTTTPSQELTVTGDLRLTGRIYDTLNSPGTNGMVLLSTGTGQTWVATSTLGFALTNDFNTSAELLALITDETGTGNLVFSSSPTFTGTVLASAATLSSTLTMSGASANIALGSNYLSGDGDDEGVYVSSTGNVGIGSTTPNEKLHVFGGNVAIDRGYSYGARYGGAFYPFVGLNSASQIVFGPLTSNTNTRIKIGNGAEDIELQANAKNIIFQNLALGTESMRITGTGNVGIGTSSPQARLTVRTTGTTDILNLFETGGSEVFTVLESGNVGIGTSSPLAMLHLQKSFSAATPSIIITDNNTTTNHEITGAGDLTFNADADSGTPLTNMIFKMDDVEYMRLQYGGNVGIGTTTPSQELTVTGDLRLTGRIYDSLNNAGTNGMVLRSTGTGQTWVATSTLGFASTNDFNTSAELLAILTDETGSGALVFGTAPTISALTTTGITTLSSQTAARALFTDASSRATTTATSQYLIDSLTDETGTGNAVFSASPTFTGTPILPSAFTIGANSFTRSGAHSLTFTTTNTTNVTFPSSGTLYSTETNSFTSALMDQSVSDDTGSGALVFGTAPTISALTTTGITTLSSQTAARALFTDASSRATTTALSATLLNSLTDETGTGVAVFSASPTFTGNTTFANASSTNLTVSGRTYLATTTVSRSFLVSGTNGGTPASGSGTRMMWVPSKGAFRAGGVSGTEWDSANIGVYSSAFGYDTIASHLGSFAMGYNSGAASSITASNLGSFAGGYAQGTGANSITASQAGSFAFGYANGSASDEGQITASGYSSFALGRAVGADARLTASGDGSFAMGYATANLTATGQASFAIGEDVNATANNAFALGQSFTNSTASTFQVGFSATPTFTVTGTRVGIASSTPSQELSVSGDISVTGRIYDSNNSPGTNGMVLLSTGTGQTWVATSTLGFASSNDFNTSAELLAILTDETGTGSAVFSASPTFTGTALASALTLSSTLTLSGTSANIALGSNYLSGDGDDEGVYVSSTGNVGIGTSTPGTFKLQVLGNIGPDADSLYSLGNTTLRFSQINTRILHGGANSLDVMSSSAIVGGGIKFSAGSGTPLRMIIDGSNGNVGIGTSSPSQKLHIEGNILVNGVSNGGLTVNTQNNINALRVVGAAVPRVVIGSGSDDAVNNLQVLGTSYFSGNVGIGTSTPLARLTVRTTGTTDILNLFETDGSEVFTVLESGNVGIGTTTPSGKLVIEDSTDGASLVTISSTVANPAVDTTLLKLSARADADAQTRYIQGYSNNNTSLMFEIYSENSTTDRTVFSTGIHSMYQSSRDISFLYNTDLASAPNAFLFNGLASNREMTSGSVNQAIVRIGGFFAQSGTASADGLVVAPTFTSLGSGSAGGTGNNIFRAANGSDTKFVINSAGLVGIGTTTPQALLTVRTTGTTDILNLFETDGSEVFTVLESGNVGIGDVDPTEAQLVIGASGAGSIYLTLMASGTTDNAVCWDNAGATLLYDCDGTPADYAESYPTENNVQFGHIVMNTEEVVTTKIGTNVPKLAKAERNEGRIIGITSDNYHDFTSAGKDEIASQDRPLPVALVGRVPVKVNLEGGEIAIGDPITISSVPGIGTKATTSGSFTIGTALESYTEEDEDNNKDTVLVFVANGTFETQADIQRQQLFAETITDDTFDLLLENQPDTIWTRLTTLAQGFVDGVLQVAGVRASEVKTDVLCVGSVCVDEETFLNLVQGSGSNSNNQDDTEEAGDEEIPETPEESASSTPPTQQEDTQPEEGGEEEVTETGNEEIPETPEEEIETP